MWDTVLTFDLIIVTSDLIISIFELIILTLYSITLTLNDHFDLLIHNLDLHLRIATILFHKYDWSFFFIMSCIIMTFYFINMILKPYNYDFNQAFFSLTCRDTLPDVPAVKNTWTDLRGDKWLKSFYKYKMIMNLNLNQIQIRWISAGWYYFLQHSRCVREAGGAGGAGGGWCIDADRYNRMWQQHLHLGVCGVSVMVVLFCLHSSQTDSSLISTRWRCSHKNDGEADGVQQENRSCSQDR